jgi:serine phosphatase RsbU (regulator of sigma subunit)
VALVIGLLLARQITGAVHDLFTGTQHLRNRDFAYAIPVRARDQLGELAESFNAMTGEVTTLLGEVAEKGRMEQEMHAAREIQQKLLPPAPRHINGLSLSAFCEPAREVAGDYYDFLEITDTMLGVLIADVSGKGLAAGLYMAQLKVIVQSLARLHHEPREFLIAVNTVVAQNLDARSFITMTYGVIDLERREMTFARAGHCPLIHVPGASPPGLRKAEMLTPDGLVVGLTIDDGELFASILEEQTIALGRDDLIVLFTDGISETMNEAFDCYGESRLAKVVQQYAHLPFDQLRSYIMAELRVFAGAADQHDDMTMILLRIG